jgi:hypothetical protein
MIWVLRIRGVTPAHSPSKTGVNALASRASTSLSFRKMLDHLDAGGATRSGDWPLRFNPAATKPFFFIYSTKSRT